jgi:DNA-binding transcriptional MerR regulator
MKETLNQIPLDFGPEPAAPPPPAAVETDGAGDQQGKQYMAAAGVGVRVKSYKNQAKPGAANGELFPAAAVPEAEIPLVEEVQKPTAIAPEDQAAPVAVEVVEPAAVVEDTAAPAVEQPMTAAAVEPVADEPVPEPQRRRAPAARVAGTRAATKAAVVAKAPSKRGRKSLKQVSAEADLIEIPEDEVLFSKQYYTMGEVAEMFRVNQSLLRFWETEFDILQPRKNKKGDRHFRPADIKNLHLIYHLLRQKKFTIEGAKEFLRKNKGADERFEVIQRLQQIKGFLLEWKAQL